MCSPCALITAGALVFCEQNAELMVFVNPRPSLEYLLGVNTARAPLG